MSIEPIVFKKLQIHPFYSPDDFLNQIENEKKILVAVNYQKITNLSEELKNIINNNIGYIEGAWLYSALRKHGIKDVVQIRGCEFWLKIIERYCCSKSFYLIGGQQKVIENTVKKLKSEYPNINIVNYKNGYFNEIEKIELFQNIKDSKPDIVFVAMGSPKQEFFMEEMLSIHPALYMGLGGSFDVYSGHVPMAPTWLVNIHLEWVYRLLKEPKRLFRLKNIFKYTKFLFGKDDKEK